MIKRGGFGFVLFIYLTLSFTLISCDDPELNAEMDDYCKCISDSRYDESKRIGCLEKMDSIREKYKGRPDKIKKVLEKTDNCY